MRYTGNTAAINRRLLPPGGRLYVPPAYYSVASDQAVQLDAAADWAATRINPEVDFLIDALSLYITAVGTEGNITAEIYSDSTALEPNGAYNPCTTDVAPTMTAANAPSPYVVNLVDNTGAAAEYSAAYDGWKALDSDPTGTQLQARNYVVIDETAIINNGDGTVGITITGHSLVANDYIRVTGTSNYDGYYTIVSVAANVINVTAAHVAETPSGANLRFQPTANYPLFLTLDLGAANAAAINSFGFTSKNVSSFPGAFTFWGSNEAAPAEYTDTDWTQINKVGGTGWSSETVAAAGVTRRFDATNATTYRWYRWKFTDVAATSPAYVLELSDIQLYATPMQAAPGTSLAVLDTIGSGDTADVWVRQALGTTYQCTRDAPIWLVLKGAASKDFSLSCRHVNTAEGSSHPDGVICKTSTDSGTAWTQLLQNSLPACLNLVINSTAEHCPKLYYGRWSGQYAYLPGAGVQTIPVAGVSLDCTALTADTDYYIYLYGNAGTLTLAASSSAVPTSSEGILVQTGATSRRLTGFMKAREIQTGYQGPVSCKSRREVVNADNLTVIPFGKDCPYYSATSIAEADDNEWHELTAFVLSCVSLGKTQYSLRMELQFDRAGQLYIAQDCIIPPDYTPASQAPAGVYTSHEAVRQDRLLTGSYEFCPNYRRSHPSSTLNVLLWADQVGTSNGLVCRARISGWILC